MMQPCVPGGGAVPFYDTSDADIVPADVTEGKIAYGADGRIVGTLNYNDIYLRLLAI